MSAVVYLEAARIADATGDEPCDHAGALVWEEQANGSLVHWLGGALGNAHGVHVIVRPERGGRRERADERVHEKAGAVYSARWEVCSDVGMPTLCPEGVQRQHAEGEIKAELGEDRGPITDAVAEAMQEGYEHALLVARRLEVGAGWAEHVVQPHAPEVTEAARPVGEGSEPEHGPQLGLQFG